MAQLSTRVAFLSMIVSSLLIYNYYSASVVSVRLNEPIFKMNDSLIELSKSNFKFSSEWVVYFEFIMKVSSFNPNFNAQTVQWFSSIFRNQITKHKFFTTKVGKIFRSQISSWIQLWVWSWSERVTLPITRIPTSVIHSFLVTIRIARLAN